MLNELKKWPQKIKDGSDLAHNFHFNNAVRLPKHVKKIAFFGMGGSGISGKIVKFFLDQKTNIPSFVIDGPIVPNFIDADTLAIVVTYSGNTWETIEALDVLSKKFIPTVVLTHGGKAAEIAEKENIPFVLLPEVIQPRFSLGNCLGFLLTLFELMEILPEGKAIVETMLKNTDMFLPKLEDETYFKEFINCVGDKEFFHVWGVSNGSAAFAYRAATQFNENSKVAAVYSVFPELAHNLLVGFSDCKKKTLVVLFYSDFVISSMDIAIDSMCQILEERGIELYKPPLLGDTWESQLFNMILWSDFASYYLGKHRGVDPIPVEIIKELKDKYQQHKKDMK
ncbi:MAG: SIS domain-containing protein [bacterium]